MPELRGFALLTPERRKEVASSGGKTSQSRGTAHKWNAEEASLAGKKGGHISRGGRGRAEAAIEAGSTRYK